MFKNNLKIFKNSEKFLNFGNFPKMCRIRFFGEKFGKCRKFGKCKIFWKTDFFEKIENFEKNSNLEKQNEKFENLE